MAEHVVRDNPEQHRFEIDLGDGSVAIAEYTLPQGKIVFTHTEVDEAFEGHGVGSALARFALDDVRADGRRKVVPRCPFIKGWIDRHPDYQELLE